MKKFLSVALSLMMMCTVVTFNGSCAFDGSSNGVPQSNVESRQKPRKRQVNVERNKKEESIGKKISNKVSGVINLTWENKRKVGALVGTGLVAGLFYDVYSNVDEDKDLIKKIWGNLELSRLKKILKILNLSIIGDKDRKDINKLNKKAEQEKNRLVDAKNDYDRIEKEKNEAENTRSNLEKDLKEKQEIVNNIKNGQDNENNVAGKSIDQLRKEAEDLKNLVEGVEANISVAQKNVNAVNQSLIIAGNNCTDYDVKFNTINGTFIGIQNEYNNTLKQLKEKCNAPGDKSAKIQKICAN